MCRDGRAKAPRDRSISPAPFASKNQTSGKMAQSGKSPAPHKRSKVSKPPAKSRTQKTAEPSVPGNLATSSSTASGAAKLPQTSGSTPKEKKSQKKAKVSGSNAQSDTQSSYLNLPRSGSGSTLVPAANEATQQHASHPIDLTAQLRQAVGDSSRSSSGSSSSSSSESSGSESESESPSVSTADYPNSGGGVNVAPVVSAGMNMPSLQSSQPPARGIMYIHCVFAYLTMYNFVACSTSFCRLTHVASDVHVHIKKHVYIL